MDKNETHTLHIPTQEYMGFKVNETNLWTTDNIQFSNLAFPVTRSTLGSLFFCT